MTSSTRSALCAFAVLAAIGAAAQTDGGPYVGVSASGSFYDVDYSKAVDNTSPANVSANAGRVIRASAAADSATWDAGVLAGYRLPLGSLYLDIEGDLVLHQGSVSSHLAGQGTSPLRNQLGDVWPEDWSLTKQRSLGATARIGWEIPALGASAYALFGLRRLDADFETAYTGCLSPMGCAPGELTSGEEQHDESFDARTFGAGLEKAFGGAAIRGEFRYTDHGSSTRTVPFTEVAVTVPVELATSEFGAGISLIWRL
ncbi:MAG: outer membrane beta-barrel protein [Gammaproteobacteria bacterium]|nr:outer membrane beta-barrel protein [Gammaproteobacteria bacterium]